MATKSTSKDSSDKSKKPRRKRKDPRIESEFYEEIEITDPVTGKKTIQKVKVTRYKAVGEKPVGNKGLPDEDVELEEFEYSWGEGDEDN